MTPASQPFVDAVAAAASLIACGFLLLRRNMLRPGARTWYSAPPLVQASLFLMAVYMGAVTISLWSRQHASLREAGAYVLLAVSAVVMVANLDASGRRGGPDGEGGR